MNSFINNLGLNNKQIEAVSHTEGPLLVLAGAGTGKTKVLTSRIAHILNSNLASSDEILAVTFTNKAAREMQHRISAIYQYSYLQNVGTFHSVSAKILRKYATLVDLTSSFSILDHIDQIRLIKNIASEFGIGRKDERNKNFLSIISKWKDMGLPYSSLKDSHVYTEDHVTAKAIYEIYQRKLVSSDLCDFGDLILYNTQIFEKYPHVLDELQEKFKYIMIDEYQDTNGVQYKWAKNLANKHRNICCVGDDDQSIYSWRGAEIENILRFEKDFHGAKIIALEQNYRSTHHILKAASSLINQNNFRHQKTLWTESAGGDPINVIIAENEKGEANFVLTQIKNLAAADKLSNIAILVRASFQTRPFEEAFISSHLNYRIIGGLKFYERAEIKDLMAYLRLIINQKDDVAFERIINAPKRSIGPSSLLLIKDYASSNTLSLFESLSELVDKQLIKGKLRDNVEKFLHLIQIYHKKIMMPHTPSDIIKDLSVDSGYKEMLRQEKNEEVRAKIDNVNELVRAAEDFESMQEFMAHVSLVTDAHDNKDLENCVNIMTIHAAKGLEFETVFIPGMEEGIFPHQRSIAEDGALGIEEERRLAYVAITRAKKNLYLLYVETRRIFNEFVQSGPSRFLSELPESSLKRLKANFFYHNHRNNTYNNRKITAYSHPTYLQVKNLRTTKEDATTSNQIRPGARILHTKFGAGIIIKKNADNLEIAFDSGGIRTIKEAFISCA